MSASSSNLLWKNVLYSHDRNTTMLLARVMQEYTSPHEDTAMGMYNRVGHPLPESSPFSSGQPNSSTNKVFRQKGYHVLRKNQDQLKLLQFVEFSKERVRGESAIV